MPIPKNIIIKNKRIGLSISGGADSSLLAYFLMKNVEGPLHFFTYGSEEKHYRTVKNSIKIIQCCISMTGKLDVYHHIHYGRTQDRNDFFQYLTDAVDNGIVDVMYTATTKIPCESVLDSFNSKLADDIKQRRNPNSIKPLWDESRRLYHPFVNLDKKQIAELYKKLDLLDTLFPLTGSCESLDHPDSHCGECWWCEERRWAFEKL